TVASSGRRLAVRCPDPLPEVRVSAAAVGHVLDVLIDNALAHGAGTIAVEATAAGAGVTVTVSDEGPGIADPGILFERRPTKGGGIGLALGRTLAAAEGGQLRLRSSRPTTFELTLPVARA